VIRACISLFTQIFCGIFHCWLARNYCLYHHSPHQLVYVY
jgi:hypothetical protein